MKNKKVITDNSIQLTIDFSSENLHYISEENSIFFTEKTINIQKKQAIVISINDCKKYFEEKRNKQIIDYIINNAKRF